MPTPSVPTTPAEARAHLLASIADSKTYVTVPVAVLRLACQEPTAPQPSTELRSRKPAE